MILGRVIGNVVSTKKEESLIGMKLMKVEITEGSESGKHLVAVDMIGAGNGEEVIITSGSSARKALRGENQDAPIDAIIVGIVD